MDLSPVTIKYVEYKAKKLVAKSPQVISPYIAEDSDELLVLSDSSISLYVVAYTREQLLLELAEQIVFLWEEYACEDSEKLTESARQLKCNLLNMFEEI